MTRHVGCLVFFFFFNREGETIEIAFSQYREGAGGMPGRRRRQPLHEHDQAVALFCTHVGIRGAHVA